MKAVFWVLTIVGVVTIIAMMITILISNAKMILLSMLAKTCVNQINLLTI